MRSVSCLEIQNLETAVQASVGQVRGDASSRNVPAWIDVTVATAATFASRLSFHSFTGIDCHVNMTATSGLPGNTGKMEKKKLVERPQHSQS